MTLNKKEKLVCPTDTTLFFMMAIRLALSLLLLVGLSLSSSIETEVLPDGNVVPARSTSCEDKEDRCADIDRDDCILAFEELRVACPKTCMICDNIHESEVDNVLHTVRNLYSDFPQQVLDYGEESVNKTHELIEEMDEYMHEMYVDEDEEDATVLQCVNKHAHCAYWASIGECDNNPSYMLPECAPACQTCMVPRNIRCAKPEDAHEMDAFKPGDLNKLFTKIVREDYRDQVAVHSGPRELTKDDNINDGPWVITIDDFLSKEETDHLIELANNAGFEKSTQFAGYDKDGRMINEEGSYRTSNTVWCNEHDCITNSTVTRVRERIQNMTGIPSTNYEHFQMLRYYENQYYKVHNDYIAEHFDRAEGLRLLTVFMYLNDVEEGGGTDFPIVGKIVMPKRGRVVVWPSVLDEDPNAVDRRTDHEATPILKGVKYASNAWIHSRDFLTQFNSGCA